MLLEFCCVARRRAPVAAARRFYVSEAAGADARLASCLPRRGEAYLLKQTVVVLVYGPKPCAVSPKCLTFGDGTFVRTTPSRPKAL
jgi:hypothetical protein